MKKLNLERKQSTNGGSFYAVALGIGILVSTVASLVNSIIASTRPAAEQTAYGYRRSAILRLSPVPSRSSISIIE